jgi:dolichyl-phosphate beta-glucosyltransferase
LSIVVPAFNEDDRLGIMLDEAMEYLLAPGNEGLRKEGVELLAVDDGSSDGTTRAAQELARKWAEAERVEIRVVRLRRNRGKGGAVQHVGPLSSTGSGLIDG